MPFIPFLPCKCGRVGLFCRCCPTDHSTRASVADGSSVSGSLSDVPDDGTNGKEAGADMYAPAVSRGPSDDGGGDR